MANEVNEIIKADKANVIDKIIAVNKAVGAKAKESDKTIAANEPMI